jgi:hypothetical protein
MVVRTRSSRTSSRLLSFHLINLRAHVPPSRSAWLLAFAFPLMLPAQGLVCDPLGNVAIFSNYDGGALTINVDENIPDLRIGVVSYEFSRITLTGPYVSNVTAIWYAGFNADNDHCALGSVLMTTISGAPAGTDSIMLYPPATWPNANGNGSIICNYSCDISTNQGGCNTADQIAHFFLTHWGGSLLFHFTQYGCWGNGFAISGGGNCCANPLATSMEEANDTTPLNVDLIGDVLEVLGEGPFHVIDGSGRTVIDAHARAGAVTEISVRDLPAGIYCIRPQNARSSTRFALLR